MSKLELSLEVVGLEISQRSDIVSSNKFSVGALFIWSKSDSPLDTLKLWDRARDLLGLESSEMSLAKCAVIELIAC